LRSVDRDINLHVEVGSNQSRSTISPFIIAEGFTDVSAGGVIHEPIPLGIRWDENHGFLSFKSLNMYFSLGDQGCWAKFSDHVNFLVESEYWTIII